MITVRPAPSPALQNLLSRHPEVQVEGEPFIDGLCFRQGDWLRHIRINDPDCEVRGLVELIDNNPMVCADVMSVPGPFETLALIALGPCAKAQLILEAPILISNLAPSGDFLPTCLEDLGWSGGYTVATDPNAEMRVGALTAMVRIATPSDASILDDLFGECYERSFFVRSFDQAAPGSSVEGAPYALYSLSMAGDDSESILRIQVVADLEGKCGDAQLVHAMNVMAGFEESLPFTA